MPKELPLILPAGGRTFVFQYDEWDRPLFIALGAALAAAQELEFHLAWLLSMTAATDNESRQRDYEGFLTRTLGQISRKLRRLCPNDEAAELLDDLVAKRNHLVHGFLRAHEWPMGTIGEYVAAIKELDETRTLLRSGSQLVTIAFRKALDLQIILVRTNPATGLPELAE